MVRAALNTSYLHLRVGVATVMKCVARGELPDFLLTFLWSVAAWESLPSPPKQIPLFISTAQRSRHEGQQMSQLTQITSGKLGK
ncbi:hypothetical protein EYF80_062573 [Liparis tanakae]|uniref:Uncharacterized protein n=1 Tax=Liparis tanakae TaxID=230148 RepID=A0A4Z2EG41_9TELE|nr:hypothetical protein EYF80_062573 [Liparis tanakae]